MKNNLVNKIPNFRKRSRVMLISTTECSLSMGRDSLASSANLWGLSLPANPIGVEHPFVPINLFIKKSLQ
ncbi:hypothetical protein BED47_13630 [Gottfriedia luciferensis]|uniref:Uncharacterized protein n=1 Tax=Gottfriedia luciferensis TaxID=178774 RepID=A0ABX2ZKY9_9BACI|nr:hypothetical protein BED47_13630 [Gottfriedia luciferensis]